MKIFKSRSALVIVVSYFTISFLYVILSERFLLYLFRNHSSKALTHEIQYYNALAFVLLTAVILGFILRKRDAVNTHSINSLKRNKLKYNNLFNNVSHGVLYTTTDGFVLAVNKAYLDLCGVTKKQILGKAIYSKIGKLIHEDSTPLESHEHPTKIAVQTKKPVYNTTIGIFNSKTQRYAWLRINSIPEFKAGSKEPYRVCSTIDDITLLKNNHDELQSIQEEVKESFNKIVLSEFLLKEASEMAKIGVYEFSSKKDSMNFSDGIYRVFDLPVGQESPFEAMEKALKKQSNALLNRLVKECMENGVPFDVELEIDFVEKPTNWIRVIGKPIYDENNDIIGRRGVIQDITDIKRSQLELELSRNKLQSSLELAGKKDYSLKEASKMAKIGYWEYNSVTDITIWSEYIHHIFGSDPKEEAPSQKDITKFFDKESQKKHVQANLDLATKGTYYDIELKLVNLKNEEVWIRNVVQPIYNVQNEIVGRRGVSQDITLEKIRQKVLDKKNERLYDLHEALNLAQKLSHVGSWKWDMTTDRAEWSDEMYNIYGVTKGSFYPSNKNVTKAVLPEDLYKVEQGIASLLINKIFVPFGFRIKRPSGEIRYLYIQALEKNSKENIFGVTKDVTEQKLASSKIEEAEKMYRLLADNANDLICLHEPDSTLKYISPSGKTILGYETSEFLGKKAISLVHKEDVLSLKNTLKEKIFNGVVMDAFPFRARHKKGHFVWLEFLVSPVYIDKKISFYVSSTRDITQWISAKQEIQEYKTSLQKLTTEITLVEEKQKKEIATNIHDHLSQSLIISKMRINELKKKPQLKMIDKDLQFIETHISEALENSRKITYELSPPVLYQLGIVAALNWLLDDVETTHKIECKFNSNVTNIKLSEVKSILLFRSIQEVITNAIKYANASLITLNIDKNKLGVYFLITDDGVGFDTSLLNNDDNHSGSGFGLFTVRERIQNIQ